VVAACLALACAGSVIAAPQDAEPPTAARALPADGPAYPIGRFNLRYVQQGHPGLPKRDVLMKASVTLGVTEDGFVAPRDDVPTVELRLEEVADRPVENYHASALQVVLARIHASLARRNLVGVYVAPEPTQITPTGQDLRPDGRTNLRILITTGIVTDVRTLAQGTRIDPEERIDHPAHERIARLSPIRPAVEGEKERDDLLRRDLLDDYVFQLSRHPGRRVDAALAPGQDPGTVSLDYLVTEQSPLVLYAQLSNTGTKSTDRLRQRFGLTHTQLTNHDDILSLDYQTAAFDQVNAVTASYEVPLPFGKDIRLRVFGDWSEYTATELGVFADIFTGESWNIGGEVIANIHQDGNLFVDLIAGIRFENIQVDNELVDVSGEEDFRFGRFGLRAERQERWYRWFGTVLAEWNDGQDRSVDPAELNRLGRLFADTDFGIISWDFSAAVFLEPLLDRAAWEDTTTPQSSTLAHELALSVRGQYAFDNRLIPQYQQVVGGLYSVRGYPQSVVAGDSVVIGTVEYRYHLPRALPVQPQPRELFGRPFRVAPQRVYGRPDWDLVLRAFVDVGQTWINDPLFFEEEETLVGTGVGFEVQVGQHINARLDWGFALEATDAQNVSSGANRVHFVVSMFF
jgi:hemolysin activation/secretion protein